MIQIGGCGRKIRGKSGHIQSPLEVNIPNERLQQKVIQQECYQTGEKWGNVRYILKLN